VRKGNAYGVANNGGGLRCPPDQQAPGLGLYQLPRSGATQPREVRLARARRRQSLGHGKVRDATGDDLLKPDITRTSLVPSQCSKDLARAALVLVITDYPGLAFDRFDKSAEAFGESA